MKLLKFYISLIFQVAIVVPFRDRQEHLNIFVRHMHKYLRWQMLEYRIFIIEQVKPGDRPLSTVLVWRADTL